MRAARSRIGRSQCRRSSGELEAAVEAEAIASVGDYTHKNGATRVTEGALLDNKEPDCARVMPPM
jgi:hypothetical protein